MIAGTSDSSRRPVRPIRQCGWWRSASTSTGCRGSKPLGSSSAPSSAGSASSDPLLPRSPRLGVHHAVAGQRPDVQRGGTDRRTDAAPVAACGVDAVRRVPAAASVLAEHLADRARPVGSPGPLHPRNLAAGTDGGTRQPADAATPVESGTGGRPPQQHDGQDGQQQQCHADGRRQRRAPLREHLPCTTCVGGVARSSRCPGRAGRGRGDHDEVQVATRSVVRRRTGDEDQPARPAGEYRPGRTASDPRRTSGHRADPEDLAQVAERSTTRAPGRVA